MTISEEPIKHFVLNCEISDFNTRFATEFVEIGSWLCNSRWKMTFYPKGPDDDDPFVWCDLVRLFGDPEVDLNLEFKFQFILPNDMLIYQTEYIKYNFPNIYGRSYHKTTMNINALLTGIRNNGFNSLFFRCLIKDEYSLDPNRQYWFNLLSYQTITKSYSLSKTT